MGITFKPYNPEACCLCGSTAELTGEHKIKASALRAEFGTDSMTISRFGDPTNPVRLAQSVKSKAFHFTSRICAVCNTTRTQAADREFDRFHQAARRLLEQRENPKLAFNDERYATGSIHYLNVFRYFAKLLCCHVAELHAPRPLRISRFATSQTNANCIWLAVDKDWTYKHTSAEYGAYQYAAHGGLIVYGDKKTGGAKAFHSTLTIGPLRYVFFSRLNWFERLELRLMHREFFHWCRAQVQKAMDQPISAAESLMLGLSAEESTEI